MKSVAEIFLKWWGTMAVLYERYGAATDIEEKPEWAEVQQLQRGWLEELQLHTGSNEEDLFETVQVAIDRVLDPSGDVAVSLSLEDAEKIIETAVEITVASEAKRAEAAGMVN